MVTRLSTSDASFYRLENTATPMYVGSLSILRRPRTGLDAATWCRDEDQAIAPGGVVSCAEVETNGAWSN